MDNNFPESAGPDRWTLIRDVGVLQLKLVVDGLRDVVLVPASLIAAIASLATANHGKPGPQFYRLLHMGKRSEQWIDLFAAHQHAPEDNAADGDAADTSIDDIVRRMESFVVDEYRSGGVTSQAKAGIDKAIAAMKQRSRKTP